MRTHLLLAAALATSMVPSAIAQRGRRADSSRTSSRDPQATISEQRFAPALHAGQRLAVNNIDGTVTVTQGSGAGAEIVARKVVRRGNGDLVRAVLDETPTGYRLCTVYLNHAGDSRTCDERNHRNDYDNGREPLDVDINYEIRLPAGVALAVNTVDGNVDARGIDTPATIRSVDGSIAFEGVAPEQLGSVDGSVTATITNRDWTHPLSVQTVDGSVELTLPASINARLTGRSVDGSITSDFPVTVVGKWGPRSMTGDLGNGHGPEIEISTVDGSIRLHSSDGHKRTSGQDRRRP